MHSIRRMPVAFFLLLLYMHSDALSFCTAGNASSSMYSSVMPLYSCLRSCISHEVSLFPLTDSPFSAQWLWLISATFYCQNRCLIWLLHVGGNACCDAYFVETSL